MAIKKVFAVYDAGVELYANPFQMISRGQALRGWEDVCHDPKTEMCQHPKDFSLHEIGEYDESTGVFKNLEPKVCLSTALEAKAARSNISPLASPKGSVGVSKEIQ